MDSSKGHFSLITFTDTTKKVCTCSALSIFLIVLFIISPLSNFFLTSVFMKILILIILGYTIYLNMQQTDYLKTANQMKLSNEISSQLKINIICSYVFTLFIGLLIIFVIKSFF
jgi:hypothetical protein